MQPQLAAIAERLRDAEARLRRLERDLPADRWPLRRDPARWSAAECVAHLNMTGEAFVPILRDGITRARLAGPTRGPRYRADLPGRLLWWFLEPPVRMRVSTPASFIPGATAPVPELIAAFERLQAEQIDCLVQADGLDLPAVKVRSVFSTRVRYNLYACFGLLAAHQHRHLWQAEQVWGTAA